MPTRDYWRVVLDSAAINQQLAVVVVAVAVPLHLRSGLLTVHTLLITDAALLLLGAASTTAALGSAVTPVSAINPIAAWLMTPCRRTCLPPTRTAAAVHQ